MVNALSYERDCDPVRELLTRLPAPGSYGEQTARNDSQMPLCVELVTHKRCNVDTARSKDAHFPSSCSARPREAFGTKARDPAGARLNDVYLKVAVLTAVVLFGAYPDSPPEISHASERAIVIPPQGLMIESAGSTRQHGLPIRGAGPTLSPATRPGRPSSGIEFDKHATRSHNTTVRPGESEISQVR